MSVSKFRGSVHALIGPNGAGKTTTFNLLTKFLSPDSGTITYEGRDITALNAARVARLGLVRSFQISATFPNLTVLENVRIPLQRSIGATFTFWRPAASLNCLNDRAMALLDDVGLAGSAQTAAGDLPYGRKRALELATTLALDPAVLLLDEPTAGMGRAAAARGRHEAHVARRDLRSLSEPARTCASQGTRLSGGEQQMLAIARVLRSGAQLLLLDEPTEGLAPVVVKQIGETIRHVREQGLTTLLVEQNFHFASRVADRHLVMENGRIVDGFDRAELKQKKSRLQEYLGV